MTMEPYWGDEQVTVHLGDCRGVLPSLPDASVDAVVCDPPYELTTGKKGGSGPGGFMGQTWDATGVAFDPATWAACLRVLKPGGHLLAFGGTRTWHRLACAIEDGGFEIRDSVAELTGHDAPGLMWIYGSGFPKSRDVSKAIDKAAGAQRQVVAEGKPVKRMIPGADQNATGSWIKDNGREFVPTVTAPATENATQWAGWGTALKPGWEPIVVGRKPLAGTVAANVLEHGTGALNVGGCRVPHVSAADRTESEGKNRHADFGSGPPVRSVFGQDGRHRGADGNYDGAAGRWPANIVLVHSGGCQPAGTRVVRGDRRPGGQGQRPGGFANVGAGAGDPEPNSPLYGDAEVTVWDCEPDCPVAELDRQSGISRSSGGVNAGKLGARVYGAFRNEVIGANAGGVGDTGGASRFFSVFKYQAKAGADERPRLPDGTTHPTVKPVDLMRWLVRLVTPPGGLVLDPFAGTGTTGEACIVEGFRCVLIEKYEPYAEMIRLRLAKPIQPDMFGGAA